MPDISDLTKITNMLMESYINHPTNRRDSAIREVIEMLQILADDFAAQIGRPDKTKS